MQSRAHEAPRREATVLVGIDGALRGEREVAKEFAAEAGVGLAIFQYWLYKLRREQQRGGAARRASRRSALCR